MIMTFWLVETYAGHLGRQTQFRIGQSSVTELMQDCAIRASQVKVL